MKVLKEIAKEVRRSILYMNHYSNASHSGSALSIVEILTVLYFKYLNIDPQDPKKDSTIQRVKLTTRSSIAGLDFQQQVEKVEDYVFMVKVN